MANSFKELIVWQRAVELAKEAYKSTAKLPAAEMYGLQGQIRRAAVSIPSNIAEGAKRRTTKDFIQFLHIASGSVGELVTQVIIAEDFYKQADFAALKKLLSEVEKMLAVLIRNLSERSNH